MDREEEIPKGADTSSKHLEETVFGYCHTVYATGYDTTLLPIGTDE